MHTVPLTTPLTANVNAEAVIDLDAIANNVRVLRDHAGSAAVMAVVKADGYGHGATQVSRVALAARKSGQFTVAFMPGSSTSTSATPYPSRAR